MKQWRDLKTKHPDALLLFRCGDFYETYGEDAKVCARELGITLTFGNNDKRREWPMAGFPHHALDTYLPKLIRNGHRVAICDQLDPPPTKKRGETINNNELNELNELNNMAQNMKAADLIGKTIVNKDGTMQYRVMNVDGDKLTVEFVAGGRPAVTMPMPWAQVEKLISGGWTIAESEECRVKSEEGSARRPEGESQFATAADDVEDVQPTAKEVKMDQPAKPKVTLRRKQSQPKAEKKPEPKSEKLTYTTYQNKAGKTCAKIAGFAEGDAMLERAAAESIHASSTYERDKKGGKHYMLIFGPRYAAAAKEVCQALNAGKTLDDCKAIIDAATEERQQKREAWKQKQSGYSDQQVADMIVEFLKGGTLPEGVMKRIPQEVIDMAA